MFLALLTLITGLAISAVAIYYSVLGLAAIFAAAPIPIYIMGTILEVSKLVTASWLKQNWKRAPLGLRTYLTISVVVLMLITSMGIFGFLSKAHSDQTLVSGDVQARLAVIDERIKTEKDNIEAARKALAQLDASVDQTMARSSNEAGATRAAQLRRQQAKERTTLQSEIAKSQKTIASLNEEAAPIRADLRKIEAEVGPIKYIAAFIYGENTDTNLLEKAVTWVIIVIVLVFDPLAVLLLLASQMSFQWLREEREDKHMEQYLESVADDLNEAFADELANTDKTPEELMGIDPKPRKEPSISTFIEPEETKKEEQPLPEPVDTTYVPGPWPFTVKEDKEQPKEEKEIQLDPIDQEIVEDGNSDDSVDIIEAKRSWKEDHPNDSLKNQRKLLELGIIKELPWEKEPYLKKKNLTYLEKVGKNQIKKEISED